ncbi:TetR/AcrR family transcriptional regulator [Paenibacillus pini]|uniref:Transcriptional regulator n=1 Tax=Paenibacillus pini JCM 16418 TaxID=1236976 RepID=W7Y9N5_9BACL|nr:TetR/AcrR family transcriptional regulator [Paenibacillus pini]GAF07745.1 transcriptional regulator [Paenibacillus pini JCM 16418]
MDKRGEGRIIPPVDRKKQVLEAATQSFSLFGYKATTMDQVAKIANVGKGTIYTFFDTKEQLFDEILLDVISEMKKIIEREVDHQKVFFDNLFRVLDSLLEFRSEHELLVKLSQEVRDFGTPQSQEAMTRVESVILNYLDKEVKHAILHQEIRECDSEIVSFLMFKMYIALTSEWNKIHEPLSKQQIQEHIRLFLEEGLAVQ